MIVKEGSTKYGGNTGLLIESKFNPIEENMASHENSKGGDSINELEELMKIKTTNKQHNRMYSNNIQQRTQHYRVYSNMTRD